MKCKRCNWFYEWQGQYYCFAKPVVDFLKVTKCEDFVLLRKLAKSSEGIVLFKRRRSDCPF
jgi:hypothetical protein